MRKLILCSFLFFSLVVFSCKQKQESKSGVELARVGEHVLYRHDIPSQLFSHVTPEDSLSTLQGYVESWVRSELLYRLAEKSIGSKDERMQKLIEDYRKSLYAYEYEHRFILSGMDTVVSESELKEFYEKNKEVFLLSEPIVRALFVIVPADSPFLDEFRSSYRKTDVDGMQALSSLSMRSGIQLRCLPEEWVTLSSIARQLPREFAPGWVSRQAKNLELEDGGKVYLVSFSEWCMQGAVAPLEYAVQSVENMILNSREKQLLQQFEMRLLQDALSSGESKISL